MTALGDIEEAARKVVAAVGRSVVGVGDRWVRGSGIVVGEGRVLTNAHNLRGEAVTVTFHDGRAAEGRPLGVDPDGDLAVLSADTGDAPAATWASDGGPEVGQVVFALANPAGRGLRVSFGMVSGVQRSFRGPRGRRITGGVEHTAALLPGSSGGPVVDALGRVLGINTHRLGEGFYLAIPADPSLAERVEALARGEAPVRPRLGVGIVPGRMARRLRRAVGLPDRDGLLVRYVEPESPAGRAGVQEGDLIVAAGDQAIASVDDLYRALDGLAPGASLDLRVVRGTEERTVRVTPAGEAGR